MGGGELSTNFDKFRQGIRAGLTPEEAARSTFTGHMAGKYGFGNVKVMQNTASKVVAEFTE